MNVHVLKVRGKDNLYELEQLIKGAWPEPARWQMPKDAQPGDLAIWYSGSPHQEYVAYGWVAGTPKPGDGLLYFGPVAGPVRLPVPMPRKAVADDCGFNRDGVAQAAQTVHSELWDVDAFLTAVGLPRPFVAARHLISAEVARVVLRPAN